MKSGLAVMVALLEDKKVAGGPFDLVGVFYDAKGGPSGGNGLEAVLDGALDLLGAEFSIVMEPTDGELQLGCRGTISATVEFHRTTAHSARRWLGRARSPRAGAWLAEMRSGVKRCHRLRTHVQGDLRRHPRAQQDRPQCHPAPFSLNLNHRFPPDRTMEEAEAECWPFVLVRTRSRSSIGRLPVPFRRENAHISIV